MVAIAKDYFESELQFAEQCGVMRFDPDSMGFDSKYSTIAETRLFVVNGKWMFGELTVSYTISHFKNVREVSESLKEFFFFMDDDRPRRGIATDLKILQHADHWEIELKFVNVSTMLV